MGLDHTTGWNVATYIIIYCLMIIYLSLQVFKFYKYKQYLRQISKTKYEHIAAHIGFGYDYNKFLFKNSIFSYLEQNTANSNNNNSNSNEQEKDSSTQDQQQDHQDLTNPIIHSSKLSQKHENQITQRSGLSNENSHVEMNQIQRFDTSNIITQNAQDGLNLITTNPAGNGNLDGKEEQMSGRITSNIREESDISSSEDEDDIDDEDDDELYDQDEKDHLKENPKGSKLKYNKKKKKPLLSAFQFYNTYWIFLVFSLPLYCLILLVRDFSSETALRIILSVFSLIPSFTVTFSIIFFACIVQNQGIFLKLKDDSPMGDSRIQNRDEYSEDDYSAENASNSNSNNSNPNNNKKSEQGDSERKIFVKHSLKRGLVTGCVFALIQAGIMIYSFCQGYYDPKFIMMNPFLILIKSINYLHISFTKQLSYSNQKIQTQKILYQAYTNFYSKHFDFQDLYEEFTASQKRFSIKDKNSLTVARLNEQNREEFRQFLESKSYLALQDFKQKEKNMENQLLKDIISNQGLKAQLQLTICSWLLLTFLPLALALISIISAISLIKEQPDYIETKKLSQMFQSNSNYYNSPSYLNLSNSNDNFCSVVFNLVMILEYIVILRIKYLLNIKVILNTTRDPKKYD